MPEVTSEECSCRLRERAHGGAQHSLYGVLGVGLGLLRGVFRGLRAGPQQLRRPGGARRCPADTAAARGGLSCLRTDF